jgi:hypothetical protein
MGSSNKLDGCQIANWVLMNSESTAQRIGGITQHAFVIIDNSKFLRHELLNSINLVMQTDSQSYFDAFVDKKTD